MEDGVGQFGSSVKLDKNPRRNAQAWPKLQLEVVKRIVRAAHREELGCTSYRKTSWEAEVAQISSCVQRRSMQLREEVLQQTGRSVKK